MKLLSPVFVSTFFGVAVIASGVWRYVERPDGEKGLWFGLVMGGTALLAAWLMRSETKGVEKSLWGRFLIWICIALVGGWFVYETLIKKGWNEAEPRMLAIIGITLATALYFLIQYLSKVSAGQNPSAPG